MNIWKVTFLLSLALVSIGTVNCWSFGNFSSALHVFKDRMSAANRQMAKPLFWVKDAVVNQVHSYRLTEFEKCLSLNESLFDIKKLVIPEARPKTFKKIHNPWNLRKKSELPLGYVLPSTSQDVITIIKCGVSSSMPLVPNSGGLSFESISWGGSDRVVVDFRNMHDMTLEETSNGTIISVEPGALVGHIHAYLWKNGKRGLPMTNQLTAGMAGDATGGGQGPFSSLYGLTVDTIQGIELIDSFGIKHEVTPETPPDLWWGLRGMGPGYIGIVTKLKLKTFDTSNLKLTSVTVRFPLKQSVTALEAFQKFHAWAESNSPSISRTAVISSDKHNKYFPSLVSGVTVQLLHVQDPLLQPTPADGFLEAVKTSFSGTEDISITNPNYFEFVATTGYAPIEYPTFFERKRTYDLKVKLIQGTIPSEEELYSYMRLLNKEIAAKRYFKLKSMFINRVISSAELLKLKNSLTKMPPHTLIQITSETGAIGNHTRMENSYTHRTSAFDVSMRYEGIASPNGIERGEEWLQKIWKEFQVLDSGETYQNYPDLDFDKIEMIGRNFKQNKGRIVDTKRKWDPQEYFKTELSIPIFLH